MKYIKEAVQIFSKKENFIYFAKVQAFLLPVAFISFVWSQVVRFGSEKLSESLSVNPVFLFANTGLGLINTVIYLFVAVASIEAIRRVIEGASFSVREAFLVAKSKVWKFFLAGLLKLAILMGGFLLLIIPGIIFSIWFTFSGIEIVLNNAGVKESLSRSKALVVGRFRQVLGKLFVIGIFTILESIVFTFLPFNLGTLISPFFGILLTLPVYLLFKELAPTQSGSGTDRSE